MGYWNFFKRHPGAKSQVRQTNRMPKQVKAKTPKVSSPGDGDGGVRNVDVGDGLVRGNDMPKALSGKVAKE